MKKMTYYLLSVLLFMCYTVNSFSQDTIKRTSGLSATFQTTQAGFMVPFWVTDRITFSPALDIKWGEKIGTDFILGMVPRFYLSNEKVSTYIGVRGAVALYIPDKENTNEVKTTDWIAGLAFGGEYFFDPRFSIGIELQGNFTKSDKNSMRFSNPGKWNFNLGTMLSANIYFLRKR